MRGNCFRQGGAFGICAPKTPWLYRTHSAQQFRGSLNGMSTLLILLSSKTRDPLRSNTMRQGPVSIWCSQGEWNSYRITGLIRRPRVDPREAISGTDGSRTRKGRSAWNFWPLFELDVKM